MGSVSRFISGLVAEEIRRVVEEVAKDGRMISAPDTAAAILKTYPKCGFDETEIANEVMLKAAQAGVGVQIGKPTKELADLEFFREAGTESEHSDRIETL